MAILVGHEGGVAQEQRLPAAVPAAVRGQAHVPRHQPLVVRVARVPDEILVNGLIGCPVDDQVEHYREQ